MLKKIFFGIFLLTLSPLVVEAGETKILYYQSKIPGPQISKDYYVKESLKKLDADIIEVKTYTFVSSPEGKTTYRSTYQISCSALRYTITSHWSSGFGEDTGLVANGKWQSVYEYKNSTALAKVICSKKK